MKNYKTFDLLKELSFERTAASEAELKAANIIKRECEKIGVEATIDSFEIDSPKILKAKLEVLKPIYKEYEVTGYGMTGNTPEEGVEAPFIYISEAHNLDLLDVEGKIVLAHQRIALPTWKKLIDKKIAGFIAISGSVYDDFNNTDLEWNILRPAHYNYGKAPGVTMRAKDAEDLILSSPDLIRLTLLEEEAKALSHNVIATLKGESSEVIAITAHYDSVKFSNGAYDNATGSTTILELLSYFKDHKVKRTLKFVWCGAEERGLLGSKDFIKKNENNLNDIVLNINLDMTGVVLGYDIAVCTSDTTLVNYIDYLANEEGFVIKASQGVYSSDSTPFADNGIPSLSFARISPRGGAEIHSRKDVLDHLDSKNYYETCKFIETFTTRMANAFKLPVPRVIPENMKTELDYYNLRKERPKK